MIRKWWAKQFNLQESLPQFFEHDSEARHKDLNWDYFEVAETAPIISRLREISEAFQTLSVAVNDKVRDPGATVYCIAQKCKVAELIKELESE